jgi:hypothetical protein
MLIVNADDWGRDAENTDRTLECIQAGAVSSVSAMVFMEDSERAAGIAREKGIDAGLHLNFTTSFSALGVSTLLTEHQQRLSQYLRRHRFAQAVFHPGLIRPFEYVVSTQIAEFVRLYGTPPRRIDGHHHMHLCANVLASGLLPAGTLLRRNFSFEPGEKSFVNRLYRKMVDSILQRRHRLPDYLFSLAPFDPPTRLRRIFSLSRNFVVEVETHPVHPAEYRFLAGRDIFSWAADLTVASRYEWPANPGSQC